MKSWLRSLNPFQRARKESPPPRVELAETLLAELKQQVTRGWSGAENDRLTGAHWGSATSTSINADLVTDLDTLRTRCRYERQHNGILEGMAKSHVLDVVGPRGPRLQVTSTEDPKYAADLEKIWQNWCEVADVTGSGHFADILGQDIMAEWDNGESIKLIVTDPAAQGIQFRLQTIHARRLSSPSGAGIAHLQDITLGVRRSPIGRPLSYFIRDDVDNEFAQLQGFTWHEVPAANVLHDYMPQEPGQVRGIPLMAASLHVIAQLRDWDRDVQQAMRMAAMLALFFYTDSPNAKPAPLVGTMDMEAGTVGSAPPGWKLQQTTPSQPGQKYNDFRNSKLAEMGRPMGMPLMQVNLDSSDHSYSSARFDGQTYQRAIEARQARMERKTCRPCLVQVEREAQLLGLLRSRRPADLAIAWGWPKRPHVDPNKEADALHTRLEDGSIDQDGLCAEYGLDAAIIRAKRLAQGLPAGPTWLELGSTQTAQSRRAADTAQPTPPGKAA